MRAKVALLVFVLSLWLPAQNKLTVDQVVRFIRSAIALKQSDKEVANYLRKQAMSERLDDRTIEELEGLGAGPKTVEALNTLRDASKSLPGAERPMAQETPAAPIPPPSPEDQRKIIKQAREYALGYTKSLPNFICTQVTRRYFDPSGLEFWRQHDTLTARLSYFDQKENYKLVLVNNRAITTDVPYMSVGGAVSSGEFGSMMKELFEPGTEADFRWDRWGKLRGRISHVFAYRVVQNRSQWHVTYEKSEDIVPGYHGLVYVDRDTNMVLRITLIADLPQSFPIQEVTDTLDYDLAPIGTQEYMLPLKAVVRTRQGRLVAKNDVEFRMYRRFTVEAEIKFDTPDPLPEEKTTEQPPQ
jgi:hypothetical protein